MGYRLGLKKTLKLMLRWPAVILTSMFTPFMYHVIDHVDHIDHKSLTVNAEKVIVLSRRWTIINLVVSTIVSSGGTVAIFHFILGFKFRGEDPVQWLFIFIIPLICMIITLLLILGLFFGHKWCCCCCSCCSPKLQRSGICVNNYDKTVNIYGEGGQEEQPETELNLKEM